jgi:hypothetical protein
MLLLLLLRTCNLTSSMAADASHSNAAPVPAQCHATPAALLLLVHAVSPPQMRQMLPAALQHSPYTASCHHRAAAAAKHAISPLLLLLMPPAAVLRCPCTVSCSAH